RPRRVVSPSLTGKVTPVRGSLISGAPAGEASPAASAIDATVASFTCSSSGADVAQGAQALALIRAEPDGRSPRSEAAGRLPAFQHHAPHRVGRRGWRRDAAALARIDSEIVPLLAAHVVALAVERQDGLPALRARAQEQLVRSVDGVVGLTVALAVRSAGEQAAALH